MTVLIDFSEWKGSPHHGISSSILYCGRGEFIYSSAVFLFKDASLDHYHAVQCSTLQTTFLEGFLILSLWHAPGLISERNKDWATVIAWRRPAMPFMTATSASYCIWAQNVQSLYTTYIKLRILNYIILHFRFSSDFLSNWMQICRIKKKTLQLHFHFNKPWLIFFKEKSRKIILWQSF